MSDEVILNDANVRITTTLAIVNGVSYPINTISAIFVKKNPTPLLWLMLIVFGIAEIGCLAGHGYVAALIVAAILAAIIYWLRNPSHSLIVKSAGTDTSVLTGRDVDYLNGVKSAIEEAVRRRG